MKRFSKDEKKLIGKFYKNNYNSREIAKFITRSKSSVIGYLERTFGYKYKKIVFNPSSEEKLGEFIGAFAGDGCYSEYKKKSSYFVRIYLSAGEKDYAYILSNFISELFGKKPSILQGKSDNYLQLKFYGKELRQILRYYLYWDENTRKTYTIKLRQQLSSYKESFIIGFIRGLIATDGCVYTKSRNTINFSTTSKSLATQYASALSRFGLEGKIYSSIDHSKFSHQRSKLYSVCLFGNSQIIKFYEKIGLTEPNKAHKLMEVVKIIK